MANPNPNTNGLIPWTPGQSGNPEGKPKGIQSWSTLVRELLEDENLAGKLLAKKPGWWDSLPEKNAGNAVVTAMIINAMSGDVQAATWLRRTGYGDKLDITNSDRSLKPVAIFDMRTNQEMVLAPKIAPKPKRVRAKKAVIVKPKQQKSKPAKPRVTKKPKTVRAKK